MFKDTDGEQKTRDKSALDDAASSDDTVQISATELAAIRQSASNPQITPEVLAEMDRRRGLGEAEPGRERELTPRQELPAVEREGSAPISDDEATQTFDRDSIDAMLRSGLPPPGIASEAAGAAPLDELSELEAGEELDKFHAPQTPAPTDQLRESGELGGIFPSFDSDPSGAVLEVTELGPEDSALHSDLFEDFDDEALDAILGEEFLTFDEAPEPGAAEESEFVLELVAEAEEQAAGAEAEPAEALEESEEQPAAAEAAPVEVEAAEAEAAELAGAEAAEVEVEDPAGASWAEEEITFSDVEPSTLARVLAGLLGLMGFAACAGAVLRFAMPAEFAELPLPLAAALAISGVAMIFVSREFLRA